MLISSLKSYRVLKIKKKLISKTCNDDMNLLRHWRSNLHFIEAFERCSTNCFKWNSGIAFKLSPVEPMGYIYRVWLKSPFKNFKKNYLTSLHQSKIPWSSIMRQNVFWIMSHRIQSGIQTRDLSISRSPLCHLNYHASGTGDIYWDII